MKKTSINILTAEYVNLEYQTASLSRRVFAVIIDWIVITIVFRTIFFSLVTNGENDMLLVIVCVLGSVMNLLIEFFCHGKTIGKYLMKIQVVSDNCTPPTFLQCMLRWLLFSVDVFAWPFIMGMYNKRLGDMAAGCNVVNCASSKVTRVSMDKDFRFVDGIYEPVYTDASLLTEKEITVIRKVLFDSLYYPQLHHIAKQVKDIIKPQNKIGDEAFLKQVLSDYYYWTQVATD